MKNKKKVEIVPFFFHEFFFFTKKKKKKKIRMDNLNGNNKRKRGNIDKLKIEQSLDNVSAQSTEYKKVFCIPKTKKKKPNRG